VNIRGAYERGTPDLDKTRDRMVLSE